MDLSLTLVRKHEAAFQPDAWSPSSPCVPIWVTLDPRGTSEGEKTCLYQNGGMGGHHGNKGAARKAVRIKLLSLSQPRSSHNPHLEPTRQPPKRPQWTKVTEPHPTANAKPQGQGGAAEGTGKTQQNTGTQGFQNEIPQAVWTCHFFCGGAQKSGVIIAHDVLWRPQSLRSRLSFKGNRNQSLRLFFPCSYLFLFFQPIHLTFPYL